MSATFSIDVDISRSIVRISMGGFFAADDIAAFLAAREDAHAGLICAPNDHCTINDLRGMKIQPQDSVAAFHELLADPRYRSRKLAFVVTPSLTRSQLLRAIGSRGARMFETEEAAEAWVLAAEDEAAAA